MPALTRAEMHVALDLELDILNSSQMTRLEAPIKDYFLNQAIENIVRDVVRDINAPNEDKRVPSMALGKGEVLNKYNAIHPLIKDASVVLVSGNSNTGQIVKYTLPDMHRFEGSHSTVIPISCGNPDFSTELPNLIMDVMEAVSFNDNPFGGGRKYMATAIIDSVLEVYNLGRYTIVDTKVIYVAKPVKLVDDNTICNLPDNMHNEVVKRAAAILASITATQYQEILNELKQNKA